MMLSWHVMPKNWYSRGDFYLKSASNCFFPDFNIQYELLSYFETEKIKIDDYDGASFYDTDLDEFETKIKASFAVFSDYPESWKVPASFSKFNPTTQKHETFLHLYTLEKKIVMELFQKTLEMISEARTINAGIYFLGD